MYEPHGDLTDAKIADIKSCLYRLVESPGEEVVVVVYIGINNVWKCSWAALEATFRL